MSFSYHLIPQQLFLDQFYKLSCLQFIRMSITPLKCLLLRHPKVLHELHDEKTCFMPMRLANMQINPHRVRPHVVS